MSYKKVRIYVEGGGDSNALKQPLRQGFKKFLTEIDQKVSLSIIAGGGRGQTFERFRNAIEYYPQELSLLLLDAEEAVSTGELPRQYLRTQNPSWTFPNASDDQYHLMVQIMESWFLADKERLKEFYGARFHDGAIPERTDVEGVPKQQVYQELSAATKDSKRGEYKEELKRTRGSEILECIRAHEVRSKASHCKRLFDTIEGLLARREIERRP